MTCITMMFNHRRELAKMISVLVLVAYFVSTGYKPLSTKN